MLNSVKHIINGFLRIGKTLFEQRQYGVFLALQFHYRIGKFLNQLIVKNQLLDLLNHKIFNPFFLTVSLSQIL